MAAWQGAFSWKGYALEGRPDLLNYLRGGDATWEEVWTCYREQNAEPGAMLRIMGLFHAFLSARYDGEGCHLDEDGDVCRQLRGWAALAIDVADRLPEERIQEALARQGEAGMITSFYYAAAYSRYMEAMLERSARSWRSQSSWPAAADPAGQTDDRNPPDREQSLLPGYYPDPSRLPDLSGEPDWQRSVQQLLDSHYASWNHAYLTLHPVTDDEELFADAGGEG